MTAHPMEQHPAEADEPAPPGDPTSLPEAIETARAEREEQGRVVLVRTRALREAYSALARFPLATDDERLTAAGEVRAEARHVATIAVVAAIDRLLEADTDLATIERRLARLEIEQAAEPLDDAAYVRARASLLADRDEARGGAAGMMRSGR